MTDQGSFEKYQARMADWASETMSSKGKPLPDLADFSQEELELFNELLGELSSRGIALGLDIYDSCQD
jgi:hypothetical protein